METTPQFRKTIEAHLDRHYEIAMAVIEKEAAEIRPSLTIDVDWHGRDAANRHALEMPIVANSVASSEVVRASQTSRGTREGVAVAMSYRGDRTVLQAAVDEYLRQRSDVPVGDVTVDETHVRAFYPMDLSGHGGAERLKNSSTKILEMNLDLRRALPDIVACVRPDVERRDEEMAEWSVTRYALSFQREKEVVDFARDLSRRLAAPSP